MCRIFEWKYSFKFAFLWRKLEFYTRVDKKMYLLIHNHILIVLLLYTQHRSLLSSFFTKRYFFLNSNPVTPNISAEICMNYYSGSWYSTNTFYLDFIITSYCMVLSAEFRFDDFIKFLIFDVLWLISTAFRQLK